MSRGLVSVIIPAYRAEQHIEEALISVKNQTYYNWEIIVVEDGFKDRTGIIVTDFAASAPEHRVEFIRHSENQGLSATRNTALRQVRGEYIAFLDHDDIWKEQHLEIAIRTLENEGELAYSTVQKFEDKTYRNLGLYGPSKESLDNFPISLYTGFNFIQPSSIVMKKSVFDRIGFFDTGLKKVEDSDYLLRTASAGFKFIYLKEISCLQRRGHVSLTSNIDEIIEWFARVLRKHRNINIGSAMIRANAASIWHLSVAKTNLSRNPSKSMEFFFWAWIFKPIKVKYLLGVLLAFLFLIANFFGLNKFTYIKL